MKAMGVQRMGQGGIYLTSGGNIFTRRFWLSKKGLVSLDIEDGGGWG